MTKTCLICGCDYATKHKLRKFCGRVCFYKWRATVFRRKTRTCVRCGKEFGVQEKKAKYCTKECWLSKHSAWPERFWAKVEKADGCWLWTGFSGGFGYGQIWDGTRLRAAHRVSYELANGPIRGGLFVLHRCDNPPCVNPDHLFLGTAGDNSRDMVAKGRDFRGKANTLLDRDKVLLIRRLSASGLSGRKIGRELGVSAGCVFGVLGGRNWGHVE